MILAYTNPNKSFSEFSDKLQAEWDRWRRADQEVRLQLPRGEAQKLVDAVSNTELGHQIFREWIEAELAANGVTCSLQVIPRELSHLNDARAIFEAAAAAVSLALADSAEKTLTTYVSPGTPIMAYTWALIARAHPQHNIAVLASSEPRLPPETVELPKELLMPSVTGPQTAKPTEYDAIFHLLGRERLPTYFGMLQFKAALHIFITTQDFQHAGSALARCLREGCQSKTVTIQDPFNPADTRRAIEKHLSRLPPTAKVAVNLTGGTKLMFAGGLAACWARGLEPFYFEISNHNILFIRDDVTVPFVGARSVDEFFIVNGFDPITKGRWADKPARAARVGLTKELWKARKALGSLYQTKEFRSYKSPWDGRRDPPFKWSWGKSRATFSEEGDATFFLNGDERPAPACDDFGQYLGGGWLEEYAYSLLRELEARGHIHDLRIGLEVSYSGKAHVKGEPPSGEFDCAFTDGKRLWLVECKAGSVKQEHIQKLENNLKTHGGIAA